MRVIFRGNGTTTQAVLEDQSSQYCMIPVVTDAMSEDTFAALLTEENLRSFQLWNNDETIKIAEAENFVYSNAINANGKTCFLLRGLSENEIMVRENSRAKHTHTNKSILDSLTQTHVTNAGGGVLDWKLLTQLDVTPATTTRIKNARAVLNYDVHEYLIYYGWPNGTELLYGGGSVILEESAVDVFFLPVYKSDGLFNIAYIFNNNGTGYLTFDNFPVHTGNFNIRFRIYYR